MSEKPASNATSEIRRPMQRRKSGVQCCALRPTARKPVAATTRSRALSAFAPLSGATLLAANASFKQLAEYRVRWLSVAYSENVVQRRGHVGTCEIESG